MPGAEPVWSEAEDSASEADSMGEKFNQPEQLECQYGGEQRWPLAQQSASGWSTVEDRLPSRKQPNVHPTVLLDGTVQNMVYQHTDQQWGSVISMIIW